MRECFNILGFDPGGNLGLAAMSIDVKTYEIISIETNTFILDKYLNNKNNVMMDRLVYLNSTVTSICNHYRPVAVGMESAFMNIRFATAVMQLSQYCGTIELSISSYNPFIKIFKYPPKYVKSASIGNGNANKEDMLKGIKKIPELNKHINTLGEHEIDAIAIAYIALLQIRNNPMILCAI